MKNPNVVFVFADQWRAQATGYAGDSNVYTPHLDRLARQSLNFSHAIAGCPVCSPARASLLTGQYPHTHGVFVNDVHLEHRAASLADAFKTQGYDTAYIGKWHLNGRGRSGYIPPEDHQGFEFWHVRECCHDYWDSFYFNDHPEKKLWPGYDAQAQTSEAKQYLESRAGAARPFLLVLSWGPPHNPYETAPPEYRRRYEPTGLVLRGNVPPEAAAQARLTLAGYYAHITALDACIGELLAALETSRLAEETIFVFWSDHGDMMGSHGQWRKQRPWDESIRVPLLVRYPRRFGPRGRAVDTPINTPDLMPTLLGLCDLPVPASVQGHNYAPFLHGEAAAPAAAALLACYVPFGEWTRSVGGREYRGVRTRRHTYVRTLAGPWLLYDNQADPYQQHNLIADSASAGLRKALERQTQMLLKDHGDPFEPAEALIARWKYPVDASLTVPYTP